MKKSVLLFLLTSSFTLVLFTGCGFSKIYSDSAGTLSSITNDQDSAELDSTENDDSFRSNSNNKQEWVNSGSLSVIRPTPAINSYANSSSTHNMLAFMPVRDPLNEVAVNTSSYALIIDRAKRSASFYKGTEELLTFATEISPALKAGKFTVVLKQEDPLWYAPPVYFYARNLAVPANGTIERFRRGALGDRAIFISPEIAIHSSPVSEDSINGVRLSPHDMMSIYDNLPINAAVIIR